MCKCMSEAFVVEAGDVTLKLPVPQGIPFEKFIDVLAGLEGFGFMKDYPYEEIDECGVRVFVDMERESKRFDHVKHEDYVEVSVRESEDERDYLFVPKEYEGLPVRKISANAQRSNVHSLYMPDSIEEIGEECFLGWKLRRVHFGSGLKWIRFCAFNRNLLESVHLPDSVEKVEFHAFEENEIRELYISENLKVIEAGVFCDNQLTHVRLPESVHKVSALAFCNNLLTHVEFGSNIKEINNSAFENNLLQEVDLPEGLLTLGDEAFANNYIRKFRTPQSLKWILISCLKGNRNLNLYLSNVNTRFLGHSGLRVDIIENFATYGLAGATYIDSE